MIASRQFRTVSVTIVLSLAMMLGFLFLAPQTAHAKSAKKTITFTIKGEVSYGEANELLGLLNEFRTDKGLKKFKMDKQLMKAAEQRAAEISVMYSHKRPNGKNFSTIAKSAKAENIITDLNEGGELDRWPVTYEPAPNVLEAWRDALEDHDYQERLMITPQDYYNIANKNYRAVGICCFQLRGVNAYQKYWVCLFGKKLNSKVSKSGTKVKKFKVTLAKKYLTKKAILRVDPQFLDFHEYEQAVVFFRPGAALADGILPNSLFTWKSLDKPYLTVDKKGKFYMNTDTEGLQFKFKITAKAKKSLSYIGTVESYDYYSYEDDQ